MCENTKICTDIFVKCGVCGWCVVCVVGEGLEGACQKKKNILIFMWCVSGGVVCVPCYGVTYLDAKPFCETNSCKKKLYARATQKVHLTPRTRKRLRGRGGNHGLDVTSMQKPSVGVASACAPKVSACG